MSPRPAIERFERFVDREWQARYRQNGKASQRSSATRPSTPHNLKGSSEMPHLIVNRPQSYWPPPPEKIEAHPLRLTHIEHRLVATLYSYDVIVSGRSDDPVSYDEMPADAQREYGAEVRRRLAQRQ